MILKREKFRNWYRKMQEYVLSNRGGAMLPDDSRTHPDWLKNLDFKQSNLKVNESSSKTAASKKPPQLTNNHKKNEQNVHISSPVVTSSMSSEMATSDIKSTKTDLTAFQILTLTYLVHVFIFAYASSNK